MAPKGEAAYRPSIKEVGMPCSQPLGAFQGREETLRGSAVAQAAKNPAAATRSAAATLVMRLFRMPINP
jgi:hypothetical protein